MKTKLLVIINRLVIGGQSLDTIPLLYRMREEFDILVLFGCRENDEMEADFLLEKFNGITLKPVPQFKRRFNLARDTSTFLSILKTIRSFKPAVVHTHGVKSGLFGRVAARVCRIKCVIHTFHGHHFHSYFSPAVSNLLVRYERLMAAITTKIVAISQEQQHELADIYKIAPISKIEVIRLGIDEALFQDAGGDKRIVFRKKYGVAAATVAIGIIGRIVPVKNYSLFVKVIAGILQHPAVDVRFFIIGDGLEKEQVQKELTRLGIGWREGDNDIVNIPVIFTSWVPEISKALYGLDIVVLTSHNEGTPMSLIEAQFCSKPVVSTNVGGVKDTFIDGETGFLVAAGDEAAFIEKLETLVTHEETRSAMGQKAAIFAREHFSKSTEIENFKLLYNTCKNKLH
ncbi:MAG TPA: glycosyltransferase [Chitinophagaceae bacterium]|nr:glycosyltransferase [Chitinophagaceae bacterium]